MFESFSRKRDNESRPIAAKPELDDILNRSEQIVKSQEMALFSIDNTRERYVGKIKDRGFQDRINSVSGVCAAAVLALGATSSFANESDADNENIETSTVQLIKAVDKNQEAKEGLVKMGAALAYDFASNTLEVKKAEVNNNVKILSDESASSVKLEAAASLAESVPSRLLGKFLPAALALRAASDIVSSVNGSEMSEAEKVQAAAHIVIKTILNAKSFGLYGVIEMLITEINAKETKK